jgi:signal transduction histidine kinase
MLVARLTEANAMLEEKNKRLDDFSASLAHDIRGPLGGISMKIDYILDTYNGELPERVKELLSRSYSSVHRLTDVVQSMYEYAKLGKQAAEMAKVDLHQLVQDAIADLHFPDELDITINLSPMPEVWGNAGLLRRVIQNLLVNAVKYNNKEKINITIGLNKTFSNTLGEFAEFFVQDNGPGVPESQRSEIFHMFVRGAGDKRDGLGVGLAIVQRIIELHYGRIWLETPKEGGARFAFVLPLGQIHFIE